MTLEEQRRLVEGARVARLATLEADGRPHVVPICFAIAGDTLYSAGGFEPGGDESGGLQLPATGEYRIVLEPEDHLTGTITSVQGTAARAATT